MTATVPVLFEGRWDGTAIEQALDGVVRRVRVSAAKMGAAIKQSLSKARAALNGLPGKIIELINPMEMLKAAALAAGAAIVGGVVASLNLALQANTKARASFDRLIFSIKKTISIIGQIILSVIDYENTLKKATRASDSFAKRLAENAAKIRNAVLKIVLRGLDVIEFVTNAGLGLAGIFKVVVAAIATAANALVKNIFPSILSTIGSMLEKVRKLILDFANKLGKMGGKFRKAAEGLRGPNGLVNLIGGLAGKADSAAASIKTMGIQTKGIDGEFNALTAAVQRNINAFDKRRAAIKRMMGEKITIHNLKPEGSGGGAAADKGAPNPSGFTGSFAAAKAGAEAEAAMAKLQARLRPVVELAAKLKEEFRKVGERTKALQEFKTGAVDTLTQSMQALHAATFQAFGAMLSGGSNLSKLGDMFADTAARIASDFGNLFIKLSAGYFASGAIAAGTGALLAGTALHVFSGSIGAKGSANRGGGGGRGGTAASASSADVARVSGTLDNRRTRDQNVTNLKVVILGEDMEGPMERWMAEMHRRGRLPT